MKLSDIYADTIKQLRDTADDCEVSDKTCQCEGCIYSDIVADKIRELANWIQHDDRIDEFDLRCDPTGSPPENEELPGGHDHT